MKKLLLLGVVVIVVALAFPVLNLVIKPDNGGRIAGLRPGDPDFAPVAAVLEAKCAGCHVPGAELPFYASFPVASTMIGADIDKGLRWLDLSKDLSSESAPVSEVVLAKLEYVVKRGSMPPGKYTALHWDSSLSGDDVALIGGWIEKTRAKHFSTGAAAAAHANEPVQPLVPIEGLDPKVVALGDKLFHDTALSGDGTISCASCHGLDTGGTDRLQFSKGIAGQVGGINSPTVYNAAFACDQFWDGRADDLVAQAAGPVENPIEMGEKWSQVVEKLKRNPEYVAAFQQLFGGPITAHDVQVAIATFEKTLITTDSPFDLYLKGDESAIGAEAKAGYAAFLAHGCATCHVGSILGGQSYEEMGRCADYFTERGNLTDADQGRISQTGDERDRHRFKVPTLRNIAVSYPYFHDGSTSSLDEAVKTMGSYNCGVELSSEEQGEIVAFLKSLTGQYRGKTLE